VPIRAGAERTPRLLTSADVAVADAFLAAHRDSSMFLRANIRRAGLVDRGEMYQATYLATVEAGDITGVAAHCWNGMLLLQAPRHAPELAQACVAATGRPVTGFAGPVNQVVEARQALGLEQVEAAVDGSEALFALDLQAVIVPASFSDGTVICREPRPDERDTLCAWRVAYDVELLGATDTPAQRGHSAAFLDAQLAEHNAWVALAGGALVSLSAINASLPDIVQLGGIYTPPEYRGRGYARAAVAATLLAARERGASRAVLFTNNPSAIRCYEAVGFERTGDYSLVLFRAQSSR
jgi:RimJ/RimL family protein N-acetyltransferase